MKKFIYLILITTFLSSSAIYAKGQQTHPPMNWGFEKCCIVYCID